MGEFGRIEQVKKLITNKVSERRPYGNRKNSTTIKPQRGDLIVTEKTQQQ